MTDSVTEEQPDPRRLATAEGAEKFAHEVMNHVRGVFAKHGQITPVAFLVLTVDAKTGQSLEQPSIGRLHGKMDNEAQCLEFSNTIRSTAKDAHAIGVMHLFTAQTLEALDSATGDEELDLLLDAQAEGSLGVKDVVFATFEHLRFPRMRVWEAEILRPDGDPTLGAFEEIDQEVNPAQSMFSGWLHHFN